jgi:hypothetical protein
MWPLATGGGKIQGWQPVHEALSRKWGRERLSLRANPLPSLISAGHALVEVPLTALSLDFEDSKKTF